MSDKRRLVHMNRDELVEVARGDAPADLVIKNGKLVNVNSGEIYPAGIAIKGDRIAAIGDVEYSVGPGTQVIDAGGRYLCPGLIDGHIHLGGSQLSMTEFARAVVPHGTTVISTDFYEIGVVAGRKAIRFALEELKASQHPAAPFPWSRAPRQHQHHHRRGPV
jgi:adenine deaminase